MMTTNIRAPQYFAYSSEHGYETYETAEKAKNAAESMISDFLFDGWDEEVETVSWGRVIGSAVMVDKRAAPAGSEFDYTCNYVIEDTPSSELLLSEQIGSENEALKDAIALLLEDARRVQQLEPNAGTESRINNALSLLISARKQND